MSADNYIYLDSKKGEVWDCTASCVCPHKKHHLTDQKSSLLGKARSLKKLMNIAKEADSETEYGTFFELWCK